MAQRYGKRAPAEAGWDLLAESLQDALTEPQQKPVPSPQSQSRLPVVSVILAIILVVTFPITMVVVNSWLGQFAFDHVDRLHSWCRGAGYCAVDHPPP